MSLVILLVVIAAVGLLTWFLVTVIPMPDVFAKALIAVAILGIVIYILQSFGLVGNLGPRLK